jgi:hypothetical protein
MALTPEGTPYVESTDLVANYPAASLSLANRVDLVGCYRSQTPQPEQRLYLAQQTGNLLTYRTQIRQNFMMVPRSYPLLAGRFCR